MRVAVTGGYGFIGRSVVRALVRAGHEVTVLGRSEERFRRAGLPAGVHFAVADVASPVGLDAALRSVECVLHLAGRLGGWGVRATDLFRVNAEGTRNVLAAASRAGVRRFVHASTPGVCGFVGCSVDEEAPYHPRGPYEESKVAAEMAALAFRERMEVVVLRPDFVYGPGDLRRLPLYRAIHRRRFLIPGSGRACWRPTYVEDVARAFVLAAEHPAAPGEVFNIAGPRVVTVGEFADTVARALGVSRGPRNVPVGLVWAGAAASELLFGRLLGSRPPLTRSQVEFLTMDHGTSVRKAAERLGFQAQVDLEQGMAETIQWYLEIG